MAKGFAEEEPAVTPEPASSEAENKSVATSTNPAASPAGQEDLSALSFDERLAVLSKQYENAVPVSAAERKRREEAAPAREWDDDERFWKPEFWAAVKEDLASLDTPTPSKIAQTFFISQIAFVVVIFLVLVSDAVLESAVRAYLLGDEFSISWEAILKQTKTGM